MRCRRHHIAPLGLAVALIVASGCERESASEAPPAKPRKTVSIAIGHAPRSAFKLPDGTRLQNIVTVVSAVELHSCPKEDARSSRILEFLVPPAHAHVPTSSTRLGDPAAADLLDGREASRVIGEVAAPLERFCTAWVVFAPADDDVLNVTPVPDEELIGATIVAADDAGTLYKSSAVRAVEVELADPNKEGPLQFDRPGSGPMLLFDVSLDEASVEEATPAAAPDAGSNDAGFNEAGSNDAGSNDAGSDSLADSLLSNLRVTLRQFDEPTTDSPAQPD